MTITKELHNYKNGDFEVSLFDDGTKVRTGSGSALFPESMDVKITNYCDAYCPFCHEVSTESGKHADLDATIELILQLPAGAEIAIGGGNPFAHPDVVGFVKTLSDAGIICNATINEIHFPQYKDLIVDLTSNHYLHGIGYSYRRIPCLWEYEHLVTHIITGVTPPDALDDIISVNKKILLLGYKDFGKGVRYKLNAPDLVTNNINKWYRSLWNVVKKAHTSFDNLAIEQLKPARLLSLNAYERFYMGEDGKFSMYLDAVKQEFAVSSTSATRYSYEAKLTDMFKHIGKSINK